MKLQINTKGAWKDVVEFDAARRFEVMDAVRMLQLALGGGRYPKFCLISDAGKREWLFSHGVTQEAKP